MKFLVIRFSSIGDIVLTTAAIRCLKTQVPNAEVHLLTKQSQKSVTLANPYIDKFHYYTDNLDSVITALRNEQFDYIIDLHKNIRTYIIRWKLMFTKVKWLSYRKLSIQKFLLTRLRINLMPDRHISLRSLDTLKPLGVIDDGKGLDYFLGESDHIKDADLPAGHHFGFIALVIGATYFTKKLPVNKLVEICSKIDYPIVLLGGKEDVEEAKAITEQTGPNVFNACGKFSLNESADIVRRSKLVISHDTGLQYVASAYQKPILAIWGGTSPKLQVEPFYGYRSQMTHQNFIVPDLPCQPCSNYGTKTCPLGHFKCMKLQDTDAIAISASRLLT